MVNLIKLEMKKFKMQGYIKGALITHLIIIGLFLFTQIIIKIEEEPLHDIVEVTTMMIQSMGAITFTVFAGVILANTIIGEYTNKTIGQMFMYPISRKKIVLSKIIMVGVFTIVNTLISALLLTLVLLLGKIMFDAAAWPLIVEDILTSIPNILINGVVVGFISLIPLYFGMRKKSVTATIVASVLVVSFMYSGNKGQSISSVLVISVLIALIGVGTSISVLNKVGQEDIV